MKNDFLKAEAKEVVNSVVYFITSDLEDGLTEGLFFEGVSTEFYDALEDDKFNHSLSDKVEKLLKKQGKDVSVDFAQDDDNEIMIEWALQ